MTPKRERARKLRYEADDRRRHWKRRWAVGVGGSITTVAAVLTVAFGYMFFQEEAADRRNIRMVRAWQLLKAAVGEPGNIGQITALETLYIGGGNIRNLSIGCVNDEGSKVPPCMYLAEVDLGPIETGGTSRKVDLRGSDLSGANLNNSDISGAKLIGADLRAAELTATDLSGANLNATRLNRAVLVLADLSGANFTLANLSGAKFGEANLSGAKLSWAVNLSPHFPSIVDIQCGEKAILL